MSNPYLTFSSSSSFTLNVVDNAKYWDGTLEYSTDTTTWNTWSGTTTISSASDGTNHNLYLRGTGNTYITGGGADSSHAKWVLTGSNISCSGNIENLLDYATVSLGNHPVMASVAFKSLFRGNANLISAPNLLATTLADSCYLFMFYGCTGLTTAPSLPATTLASRCYKQMFQNCSSLTTPPSLPATTLTNECYYSMFYGCTSLTSLPELPATTLIDSCYTWMFAGCPLIKVSVAQTGEYQTPYRIPSEGAGTDATSTLSSMFTNTGGSFTGTPSINTTYYTSNTIIPAVEPTQPSISIGTLSLSKAILGTTELSAIWLGNVKIYEKGSPTPSGYSGNIAVYGTFGGVYIYTKIKFDTPPTDDNDYDSYVNMSGELTGLTSYQNKTKIYIWCDTDYDNSSSFVRINGITYNGSRNYSQATEVLLTGNYDIELGYSRTGGAGF